MQTLLVTIVPPVLEREADERFRRWCESHPALMARATDEMFIVSHIRGVGLDGTTIAKRQYRLRLDASLAGLLVGREDWTLDVVVVGPTEPAAADEEFLRWWEERPELRAVLGEHGFNVEDLGSPDSSQHLRQYRVQLKQTDADLLLTSVSR